MVDDVKATARTKANDVLALLEQAVRDLERERPEPAVRAATNAKALATRSSAVREILGLALYDAGRFREALREFQAYKRITGRLDQNHLMGDCHRALGAPEKAFDLVQDELRAKLPEQVRAEAAVVGGAALADMGRFDEALSFLRRFPTRADEARPHDLRIWYVLGDVLSKAGRPREAAQEFRKIVRHDPTAFDVAERLAALG